MQEIRLTLQNRIISLMITSSIIIISAFTLIQLNNQLNNLTRYNSYQANLSGIITKNNLEEVLKKVAPEELPRYMQSGLNILRETNIINEAAIFEKDGKIIAATRRRLVGDRVSYGDLEKWQNSESGYEKKWFTSEINKIKRQLDMFIPLKGSPGEPISHMVKISFSLGNIQEALLGVYRPVTFATIIIILANIILGYMLSRTIIEPIKMLNKVTKIIAGGDLSIILSINTNDELEELALTFNQMTKALVKMKERAENANPLTKLPGNILIQEKVEKKISENQKFVVIYCDLDNFKAFNDKYGIAKGDEAIKLTASILKESIRIHGNPDDFLGHEGGDDFLLISTLDKAQNIADYITGQFDKRIRTLYNPADLAQGSIICLHSRDGSIKQFPIMTISLAGITNEYKNITTYGEVTNIAAEVKKAAKEVGSSVFIIDRRRNPENIR